jgi:hypothetical protein
VDLVPPICDKLNARVIFFQACNKDNYHLCVSSTPSGGLSRSYLSRSYLSRSYLSRSYLSRSYLSIRFEIQFKYEKAVKSFAVRMLKIFSNFFKAEAVVDIVSVDL